MSIEIFAEQITINRTGEDLECDYLNCTQPIKDSEQMYKVYTPDDLCFVFHPDCYTLAKQSKS